MDDFKKLWIEQGGKITRIEHYDMDLEDAEGRRYMITVLGGRIMPFDLDWIEEKENERMLMMNDSWECDCIKRTKKGVEYHPGLRMVYARDGPKGKLVKVGRHCPNCKAFYDLVGEKQETRKIIKKGQQ